MGKVSAIVLCLLILCVSERSSTPLRGDVQWTMLLCKYKGSDFIPNVQDWYTKWLTDETANGSIAYFFRRASNGVYTTGRSRVYGWFEIPFTMKQVSDLGNQDQTLREAVDPSRRVFVKTKQICYDYATTTLKISVPDSRLVITAINDQDTAVFCLAYGVLVTPRFTITSAIVHEMAHSFDLGHSYSDSSNKVFSHGEPGEYDDKYDIMSTANAFMYNSDEFGPVGPGFNGPSMDYLGWLPAYRMYYFGKADSDKLAPQTIIRLSSLSRPHRETSDWLLIMIPYERDDSLSVYTVELRTQEFLDSGTPKAAVLIHQVSRRDNGVFLYSKVLNQGAGEKPKYELLEHDEWKVALNRSFGSRFIRVRVNWIDESSATAEVEVSSDFSPTACARGEVQRRAFDFDLPCVSVGERDDIQRQNEIGTKLTKNGKCTTGTVRRRAGPNDDVCVTQVEYEQVRRQNERWRKYTNFYDGPTFGLNACKDGYRWRQIDPYDYVCIEESRDREWERQNEQHKERIITNFASDPNECADGFRWRRAVQFDEVCVTKEEWTRTQEDNTKITDRLKYPRFFDADSKLKA